MRLLDHLLLELQATGLTAQDREEAMLNFALTPYYVERVLLFGGAVCLDSFLYILTILPLRSIIAVWDLCVHRKLAISRKGDLVKGAIVLITLVAILQLNTSKVYHAIRGQAGIKLFVMYSILEVADKFCCAIGQDIIETLVSLPTTLSVPRTVLFSIVSLLYSGAHSFVLTWQLVTLNVAVNSYSNALLTLMLTSQFGEIKSAVFKKFDRETLFQLTCADITQRFQLFMMLLVIAARNLLEAQPGAVVSVLQQLGPASMVLCSMVVVDWLKHAYIARFNNLRPQPVYSRFLSILVGDYVEHRQLSSHHLMMKRTGLPVLPLAIVCMRMLVRLAPATPFNVLILWVGLLVAKLLLGMALLDYTAAYVAKNHKAEKKRDDDDKRKNDLDKVTPFSMPNKAWH